MTRILPPASGTAPPLQITPIQQLSSELALACAFQKAAGAIPADAPPEVGDRISNTLMAIADCLEGRPYNNPTSLEALTTARSPLAEICADVRRITYAGVLRRLEVSLADLRERGSAAKRSQRAKLAGDKKEVEGQIVEVIFFLGNGALESLRVAVAVKKVRIPPDLSLTVGGREVLASEDRSLSHFPVPSELSHALEKCGDGWVVNEIGHLREEDTGIFHTALAVSFYNAMRQHERGEAAQAVADTTGGIRNEQLAWPREWFRSLSLDERGYVAWRASREAGILALEINELKRVVARYPGMADDGEWRKRLQAVLVQRQRLECLQPFFVEMKDTEDESLALFTTALAKLDEAGQRLWSGLDEAVRRVVLGNDETLKRGSRDPLAWWTKI